MKALIFTDNMNHFMLILKIHATLRIYQEIQLCLWSGWIL